MVSMGGLLVNLQTGSKLPSTAIPTAISAMKPICLTPTIITIIPAFKFKSAVKTISVESASAKQISETMRLSFKKIMYTSVLRAPNARSMPISFCLALMLEVIKLIKSNAEKTKKPMLAYEKIALHDSATEEKSISAPVCSVFTVNLI